MTIKHLLTGAALCLCLPILPSAVGAQTPTGTSGIVAAAPVRHFDTAAQAADAFVSAASTFDMDALRQLFGPALQEVVLSGEGPQDRARAAEFVAKARERQRVSMDPRSATRAFL